MQEILLKIRYFEGGLSKNLKKLISFFLSNSVPFNRQSYLEQKGSGTSDQSLSRLQNKFRKIPLLVIISYNLNDRMQFTTVNKCQASKRYLKY